VKPSVPDARLHHFVPQFYLRRFGDSAGKLWVWDRDKDRTFKAKSKSVAAANNFYRFDRLATVGHDPLTMEKQLSHLEGEVAKITAQWLSWLRQAQPMDKIPIPEINRELVASYIAIQFLRAADARRLLSFFDRAVSDKPMTEEEIEDAHIQLLWDEDFVSCFSKRIQISTWMFGRNATRLPFITSDNPVAFRTGDNRIWLRTAVLSSGTYVVFPLAPDIVMYCYPIEEPFVSLSVLDSCLSPVTFTEDMVDSENCGQVFMASRFIFSRDGNFEMAREFARTIGTDTYAQGDTLEAELRRTLGLDA